MRNTYIRYATKTTLEILTHLYSNCTRISITDMVANDYKLRYPYNKEETLKSIIERINKCAYFTVGAVKSVTETHLIRI